MSKIWFVFTKHCLVLILGLVFVDFLYNEKQKRKALWASHLLSSEYEWCLILSGILHVLKVLWCVIVVAQNLQDHVGG